MLRSRNTSSASGYQPVETSEYEVLEHEGLDVPEGPSSAGSWLGPISHVTSTNPDDWFSSSRRGSHPSIGDDELVQTVSRADSVTLSHPTPDSHSIHRSHAASIQQLEKSAERLSLSEDIGEELKKLREKEKRADSRRSSVRAGRQFSTASHPSSIVNVNSVARSGGFSPEAYVASPAGSFMSPWSAQSTKSQGSGQKLESISKMAEPVKEGRPLDFPPSPEGKVLRVRNSTEQDSHELQEAMKAQHLEAEREDADRPHSAASGDTFHRAREAFADFDGVHIHSGTPDLVDENYGLLDPEAALIPPDDEEPQLTYVPPDHENMIYYPAPVPVMLSLPAKLSKGPSASQVAKRRSEILRGTTQARQSAPDLAALGEHESGERGDDSGKRTTNVPPQLRASLFFDQPSAVAQHNIEMIDGSAVRTLDSILDASAYAPVAAFTDHPVAGREGAEIYAGDKDASIGKSTPAKKPKQKRRGSSFFAFGTRLRGTAPPADDNEEAEEDKEKEQEGEHGDEVEAEEEEDDTLLQRPSTLLAELQIRKAQQKQRNRTAATAFPNGMHSTLLQLDAVAQYQKQARKKKHVALAWENSGVDEEDDPDEDVPLGVLYPGTRMQQESGGRYPDDQPLGLLAQRSLEENEPLTQRKARLQGGPPNMRATAVRTTSWARDLQSAAAAHEAEEPEETLGQRQRRLREQAWRAMAPRPVSKDFASEVLSQFGVDQEQDKAQHTSKTPDPEETLGQRKRRLQAEKQARQASGQSANANQGGIYHGAAPVQNRRSMADLLQSNPVGAPQLSANVGPRARHASTFQSQPTTNLQHPATLRRSRTDQPVSTVPQPYPAGPYPAAQYQPGHVPPGPYPFGTYPTTAQFPPVQGAFVQTQYPNPMAQYPHHPAGLGQQQPYAAAPNHQQHVMVEQASLHPAQWSMIEQWRQSVR